MRLIYFAFCFFMYFLSSIPLLWIQKRHLKRGKPEKIDAFLEKKVKKWGRFTCKIAGINLTVEGLENQPDEPAVYIANHQSNFDIPVILSTLKARVSILAKPSLEKIPLFSSWMALLHCEFISRTDKRKTLKALMNCAKHIQDGYSLLIFPEGTRSRNGTVGKFKDGAFSIVGKTRVPIVPICIEGTYNVFEAHGRKKIKPSDVTLKYLKPILTVDLSKEEIASLSDEVRNLIIENKG